MNEPGADVADEVADGVADDGAHDDQGRDVTVDDVDVDVDVDETGRLIRPYAMTGGRTGADGPEIHLESQVVSTPKGLEQNSERRWEAARVIDLAEHPVALVEIAARLEIPIGVARVIVADLVADGAVTIHVPDTGPSFTSLLERVLNGVRQL